MSTPEPFVYRLKALARVVDGDTLDLDLGFSLELRQRVRLYGLDAPVAISEHPAVASLHGAGPSRLSAPISPNPSSCP